MSRRADLGEFAEFTRRESHVLGAFPEILFQQAANWPDGSAPCDAANRASARVRRPWLRWRNKPAHLDPCRLTIPARAGAGCEIARATGELLYTEGPLARVRDLTGARLETVIDAGAEITACAFSPDGREVVTASRGGSLGFWDAATGAPRHRSPAFRDVAACAFAPDGSTVAVGLEIGHVAIFEVRGGLRELRPHAHARKVTSVSWSPDGRRLLSLSIDGALRVWEGLESEPVVARDAAGAHGAWSPRGDRFATVALDEPVLRVWDADTVALLEERVVRPLAPDSPHTPGGQGGVAACAWSPDGARLALGCWDCSVRIRDAETLAEHTILTGHAEPVVACAFASDGGAVIARDQGGTIKVFDLRSLEGAGAVERHTGLIAGIEVSRDRERLASESWDGTRRVWDLRQARCLAIGPRAAPLPAGGPWSPPPDAGRPIGPRGCEVRSPRGSRTAVIAAAGRSLELREAKSDARIAVLEKRSPGVPLVGLTSLLGVTACAFSPDGEVLASVSDDRTLKVRDAREGSILGRFPTAGVGTVVAFTAPRDLVCGDATGGLYFLRVEDGAGLLPSTIPRGSWLRALLARWAG